MRYYNSKQKRELQKNIDKSWGATIELNEIIVGGKNKLWHATKTVKKINTQRMRVETLGVYFGKYDKRGDLRLSIEGSQKIGPNAVKNVVEIDDKEFVAEMISTCEKLENETFEYLQKISRKVDEKIKSLM